MCRLFSLPCSFFKCLLDCQLLCCCGFFSLYFVLVLNVSGCVIYVGCFLYCVSAVVCMSCVCEIYVIFRLSATMFCVSVLYVYCICVNNNICHVMCMCMCSWVDFCTIDF